MPSSAYLKTVKDALDGDISELNAKAISTVKTLSPASNKVSFTQVVMSRYGNVVELKGYINILESIGADTEVIVTGLPINIANTYNNAYFYEGIGDEPKTPKRLSLEVQDDKLYARFGAAGYSYLIKYSYICK